MRFPQWVRGSRAFEITGLGIICVSLVVGLALGWHRAIPGLGEPQSFDVAAEDDHAGHDHASEGASDHAGHDHAGHDEANSLELSEQARRSLGLDTAALELGTFVRRISVPATIVDWPGRTHIAIAAPLTGTVTSVHITSGETVASGAPLYTLRLTHQDLVETQSEFLRTLGEADVEQREVNRLSEVAQSGAIARKSLLERQYALDKLEAVIRAQRESLLLHGLAESQVAQVERMRRLIREVTVFAPALHEDRSLHDEALSGPVAPALVQPVGATSSPPSTHPPHAAARFVVTELAAKRGQSVTTGETLTVLANYESLLAEGHAFQQDAEALATAVRNNWPIQAVLESGGKPHTVIDGLQIAYVGGEVLEISRALPFYVPIDNEIVQQEQRAEHLYVSWRFKPGQRLRLRVPVDRVSDVFVLPVDAVASEGAERYVFVENGDHFDRRTIQVATRDQLNVAVANDGSLLPGESVVLNGAHQLQMALKNKAGGGVDPHAGHNH